MQIPSTLNGHPVIAALPRVRAPLKTTAGDLPLPSDLVVLVQRPDEHHPFVTALWFPRCGDSWDQGVYLDSLTEGLASLAERAGLKLPDKHDEGDAPPHGFTRYQVEIDIHDDVDPSTLLEEAQSLAAELNPYSDDDESTELNELIDNRVSIQRMEG